MSPELIPLMLQPPVQRNRKYRSPVSARRRISRRSLVAPSVRVRRDIGETRSNTGVYRSRLVMESDGNSSQDRAWKPAESRISPERLQRFRDIYFQMAAMPTGPR